MWTNIKKFYPQNNIFKKEYEILNHLYFGLNFIFSGTAIGRFRQIFLLIFSRRPTMAAVVFTQPPLTPHPPPHPRFPHHKKAFYNNVIEVRINNIWSEFDSFYRDKIWTCGFSRLFKSEAVPCNWNSTTQDKKGV